MGILQRDLPTRSDEYAAWDMRSGWYLPSGWWVLPGVMLGLGIWTLIGYGLVAAMAGLGGPGTADFVTQAAPMGGPLLTGR